MKNIKEVLDELVRYYCTHRAVGSTHTMMKGVENNPKARAVCLTQHHGKNIGLDRKRIVLIDRLETLAGIKAPLAFDNLTLQVLFQECRTYIRKLEDEIKGLKK